MYLSTSVILTFFFCSFSLNFVDFDNVLFVSIFLCVSIFPYLLYPFFLFLLPSPFSPLYIKVLVLLSYKIIFFFFIFLPFFLLCVGAAIIFFYHFHFFFLCKSEKAKITRNFSLLFFSGIVFYQEVIIINSGILHVCLDSITESKGKKRVKTKKSI